MNCLGLFILCIVKNIGDFLGVSVVICVNVFFIVGLFF